MNHKENEYVKNNTEGIKHTTKYPHFIS